MKEIVILCNELSKSYDISSMLYLLCHNALPQRYLHLLKVHVAAKIVHDSDSVVR